MGDRAGLLKLEAVTLIASAVLVEFAAVFEVVFGVGLVPGEVGAAAGSYSFVPLVDEVLDTVGELLTLSPLGDVVGGAGLVVAVSQDGAHVLGGPSFHSLSETGCEASRFSRFEIRVR